VDAVKDKEDPKMVEALANRADIGKGSSGAYPIMFVIEWYYTF